ncbi:hypothetical protein DAEQUDRAFT_807667 [Daedalea quercina L-15889]|uniref:Uncharacterized protein n=1 Tax=Daedalea quercina L-15889 TaxID=1314783 RepID=A0A165U8T6_9APHY|nr:hypothetical protein DAEQUDRAFT_807667 [Daedalea quercina L-15889]
MMKSLRKSLNSHKDPPQHITTSPLPSLSKPPSAILPPKKVIRALSSYKSTAPQELSFEKGDFFHVLNDVNSQGLWYEAHNPMTGARGLVPCHLFEEFQKGTPVPKTPTTPGFKTSPPMGFNAPPVKPQAFYAVVLHDFTAERADELDAKAGDPITVVAQSNREWFVAKPIGRLGRPGLIPVSFVEIRDPATGQPVRDIMALIDGGALPRVEEWKTAMMTYKQNSISLGVLDDPSAAAAANSRRSAYSSSPTSPIGVAQPPVPPVPPQTQTQTQQVPPPVQDSRPPSPKLLPDGILLSADVKSFHYEMDEYWYRVHSIFQPYPPPGSQSLPPARQLVLFRSYNDFYDFQVDFLDAHPDEAGRLDGRPRVLPYMPGPVNEVDNEIANKRRAELDEYLRNLCELRHEYRYLLEHHLVRSFLSLKPGDADVEVEPRTKEIDALFRTSYVDQDGFDDGQADDYQTERMSRLRVSSATDDRSDGSDYGDDGGRLPPPQDRDDSYRYGADTASPYLGTDQGYNTTQPLQPRSRNANGSDRGENGNSMYSQHSVSALPPRSDSYQNGQSRTSLASSQDPANPSGRVSQAESTRTSTSGRSRSQSHAAPPVSASNPQIAYIKIKIFAQNAEEIVAIRVHPRVTHAQLMAKASERLQSRVAKLRYRDSVSEAFVDLRGDSDLRQWLDNTERHVLYAG